MYNPFGAAVEITEIRLNVTWRDVAPQILGTTVYGDVTTIGHINQTLNRVLPPNSITLLNESTTLSVVNPFHAPNDYHTYDLTIDGAR